MAPAFLRERLVAQFLGPACVRLSVIYLGVLTTAFTNWLQTIGQQSVPATTASAIYALDPPLSHALMRTLSSCEVKFSHWLLTERLNTKLRLWGAFFAYLFLGEALGTQAGFPRHASGRATCGPSVAPG